MSRSRKWHKKKTKTQISPSISSIGFVYARAYCNAANFKSRQPGRSKKKNKKKTFKTDYVLGQCSTFYSWLVEIRFRSKIYYYHLFLFAKWQLPVWNVLRLFRHQYGWNVCKNVVSISADHSNKLFAHSEWICEQKSKTKKKTQKKNYWQNWSARAINLLKRKEAHECLPQLGHIHTEF